MKKRVKFTFYLLFLSSCWAQETALTVNQLLTDINDPDKFSNTPIDEDVFFAPISDGDSDLGDQLILRRHEEKTPLLVKLKNTLYYSNNVLNVASSEESSLFNATQIDASWTKPLKNNWLANITLNQGYYFYEGNNDLDFSNVRASTGIVKFLPSSKVTLNADLGYDYTTEDFLGDEIYSVASLTLGANRTFLWSKRNISFLALGFNYDFFSTEELLERNEISARVGHRFNFTDTFSVTAYSKLSQFYFNESSREDSRLTLGVALNYNIASNLYLTSSYIYTTNDSNRASNEFETILGSIGVGITGKF